MRIQSISLRNFGPFAELKEVRLGSLATLVGQNDVGKSSILRALEVYFEKAKMEEGYVHAGAGETDEVTIEVAFGPAPGIVEFEEGVATTLEEERMLDAAGCLRIRKVFGRANISKHRIVFVVQDFLEDKYAGLAVLKESELNKRCAEAGIEAKKSGSGITNKSKRQALRARATADGIATGESLFEVPSMHDLWKRIAEHLPSFALFQCDTKLGVGETGFQSAFRAIVSTAAQNEGVVDARQAFTGAIRVALQSEVAVIFDRLKQHTDAFGHLAANPQFAWDKAVTLDIVGTDRQGVERSFDQRGAGMRRLLMVAFFQYLAEKVANKEGNFVFALEEPENCLHPGLQRELVASFRRLADRGYQLIISSHSPVFAGASPTEDLALICRSGGVAWAVQHPKLDLADVASELGVEPADQVTGYHACVFVEGPDDWQFWQTIGLRLKEGGIIPRDFEEERIGFIVLGGDNLKHWVTSQALGRLNRRFAVVVDSDRDSETGALPARKQEWQKKVVEQGGRFFILRKRAIENYIHPEAVKRTSLPFRHYDDYTDVKRLYGQKLAGLIETMSCEEIREMDRYDENGVERHELAEIAQCLLKLPDED